MNAESGRIAFVERPCESDWSPLGASGWIAFSCERWGLAAHSVSISEQDDDGPRLEIVMYRDRRGRVAGVPHTPYLPVRLQASARSAARQGRQRLFLAMALAETFRSQGTNGFVALEPTLSDVRPFQWLGFDVEPRFTYYLDLPSNPESWSANVRKACRKAKELGYVCERTSSLSAVAACLTASAQRQGFRYLLNEDDLRRCRDVVGDDRLRLYLCLDPDGRPASARVILHGGGVRAIDLLAGTEHGHLQGGATQLLTAFALEDLVEAGATGFDHAGANIPRVARAKADWGGQLVAFYAVRSPGIRSVFDATMRSIGLRRQQGLEAWR